jgi:23S rRNA pseudouridine2605 synthase
MEERLQKIMARAGFGSRRANEELLKNGRVQVNGQVAHLGDKADPDTDLIEVDGRRIKLKEKLVYVALNKPKGVLSSTEDEMDKGRPTVRDLIPIPGHLYPVGRLDRQSDGLMLLTNDGDLAHKLTHPRYGHEKSYLVLVDGQLTPEQLQQWRNGVLLDGEMTAPADVKVLTPHKDGSWLQIIMREGRKRQIRRIASLFDLNVRQLTRERIGPLQLGDLKPGVWRHLTAGEVTQLREHVAAHVARQQTKGSRRNLPAQGRGREVAPARPAEGTRDKINRRERAERGGRSEERLPAASKSGNQKANSEKGNRFESSKPTQERRHRRPGRVGKDNRRPDAGRKT